ncbi:MAG: high frequency lysogenization protein HflD [Gammaproteobacteria bacterium]|nr:high frequency lysogenization protein HflD [Gammaproteobacteria bacterium]
MRNERDRCIAFAGIFQAAALASQIAHRGMADMSAMEASIHSLFMVNADSVDAVYGGLSGVTLGLKALVQQLQEGAGRDAEVTRYVIALIHLEGKLKRHTRMLDKIATGIRATSERTEHFPMLHANIVAGLAEIYTETISTLRPRIMVHGEPLHLQNPENINKIRTLLLAGIRSAMLWRQCGGSKLQILMKRRRLLELSRSLLAQG